MTESEVHLPDPIDVPPGARGCRDAEEEGEMREHMRPDPGFDVDRYRKLLAEAVDETKRLALINLLIEERAKERLEEQVAANRAAITVQTITAVVSISRS
jgi:hypothetical protein